MTSTPNTQAAVVPPVLEVRDLAVEFVSEQGTTRALDGVSFDLHPGRVLGIVGESGCGKSVTARAILQLIDRPGRIVGGTVTLYPRSDNAADLLALPPESPAMRDVRGGRIGLIFQEPMASLSMHYTVGNQIIESVIRHRRVSPREARQIAIDLLRDVGIPDPARRIDEYPFRLSGGLRQRTGIALALAGDPDIVIADEPTTALDVTTQAQILALLRKLQHERRVALMLITHDMGVIAEMADDVVVMYAGRVAEFADVNTLFTRPQHPYTRALLRSVPSVFAQSRERLPTIGGAVPTGFARPSGCPFHPRCPEAIPGRCNSTLPRSVDPAHRSASCLLMETGASGHRSPGADPGSSRGMETA